MNVVIVTGGRGFTGYNVLAEALEALKPDLVVQGGASGADTLARLWATKNGIPTKTYPADWEAHGRAAGPIRNRAMLKAHPSALVVAFPGGPGTANCVSQARTLGMRVKRVG